MTLNDLKTGMIVTLRDGTEAVVLRGIDSWLISYSDVFVNSKTKSWFHMRSYTDDFKCRGAECYDVVKIEQTRHPFGSIDFDYDRDKRKVLWEEQPTKKLTVTEIEKLLGYKVEIVSEEE